MKCVGQGTTHFILFVAETTITTLKNFILQSTITAINNFLTTIINLTTMRLILITPSATNPSKSTVSINAETNPATMFQSSGVNKHFKKNKVQIDSIETIKTRAFKAL